METKINTKAKISSIQRLLAKLDTNAILPNEKSYNNVLKCFYLEQINLLQTQKENELHRNV